MKSLVKDVLKKMLLQISIIGFICLLFLVSAAGASAQTSVMRRYAVYVGSNYGGHERVTLSYAVTDARALSDVMQRLGGVMPADGIVLTDPSPALLKDTISTLKRNVSNDTEVKRSEFFFYYSGHSDEKGLLLGDSVMKYEDLKELIDSVGADVNIAVLDSCSSGAFTRMKGGVRRSPFLSDESVDASGHAFLTSSSEDEAAQESDDLGASFFTHYLITALRGAADSTFDGTVTLNEAYSYAASETLARTEDTLAGPQHPSYDIQLAGTGELILTDLREVSEQIMFEKNLRGRIFVRDSAGRLVVELKKIEGAPLAVSIAPGRYSMILDDGDQLLSADLMLSGGAKVIVQKDEFYPVPGKVTTSRGGTFVAVDTVPAPALTEEPASVNGEDDISRTASELDEIAERARRRALEAAGMSESTGGASINDTEETVLINVQRETGDAYIAASDSSSTASSDREKAPDYDPAKFSLGFVASEKDVSGIQLGLIGATTEKSMKGFQIGGIFAESSGTVDGFQIGGIFSSADDNVDGFQISGIWNATEMDVMGAQISGIWNSARDVAFLQAAGIFNVAERDVRGLQLSGIFNIAEGNVYGAQGAGIFNVAENVNGFQAGLFNFGGKVYGLQVGLVNISDELYGLPIGLINISGNGLNDVSFSWDDLGFGNISYQLGTSSVYTFMNFGYHSETPELASTLGLGMGLEIGGERLYFDMDIYAKAVGYGMGSVENNVKSVFEGTADYYPAARLSGGFKLFGSMSIFAGVNWDFHLFGNESGYSYDLGSSISSFNSGQPMMQVDFDSYNTMEVFPSFFLGVRL